MRHTYVNFSMLKIDIWTEAQDFLETLIAKQQRQISAKLFFLAENPMPPSSKLLKDYAPLRRYRSGTYRIIYFVEKGILRIPLIDKRGDDKVYRLVTRKFKK